MILILSQESFEYTTDVVLDWLRVSKVPTLRLNGTDFDSQGLFTLRIADGELEIEIATPQGAIRLDPREVKAVWYRRWFEPQPFQGRNLLKTSTDEAFQVSQLGAEHLLSELRRVSDLLFHELAQANWLSEPRTANPNKLRQLKLAAQVGFDTPATLVTTSKSQLLGFAARHGSVITKPMSDFQAFTFDGHLHVMYTRELSAATLAALPDRFFPSLFQERLAKAYELRVFYLAGECYSSAIFSQLDDQTAADFRNYNHQRPNRVVPYRLPAEVAARIGDLMNELDLETGSLDFVKTRDGRLVFLEVNPVGQFLMVSLPCNYYLERKVASLLARKAGYAGPL
jgi:ATP-GRASP peptide maturase of grasp-with-spasm system